MNIIFAYYQINIFSNKTERLGLSSSILTVILVSNHIPLTQIEQIYIYLINHIINFKYWDIMFYLILKLRYKKYSTFTLCELRSSRIKSSFKPVKLNRICCKYVANFTVEM